MMRFGTGNRFAFKAFFGVGWPAVWSMGSSRENEVCVQKFLELSELNRKPVHKTANTLRALSLAKTNLEMSEMPLAAQASKARGVQGLCRPQKAEGAFATAALHCSCILNLAKARRVARSRLPQWSVHNRACMLKKNMLCKLEQGNRTIRAAASSRRDAARAAAVDASCCLATWHPFGVKPAAALKTNRWRCCSTIFTQVAASW